MKRLAALALLAVLLGGWTHGNPNSSNCPFGSALSDGCAGAQASGITPFPNLLTPKTVTTVAIITGSGYSNGTYTWTSSGGGCSVNATGQVTVSGGNLGGPAGVNYTISNAGSGCTSTPTISVPAGAGAGTNGSMTAVVYQATPHNASTTWNMPGVDYPIGYSRALSLLDPTNGSNLPGCATYASQQVTVNSGPCTLTGFDFTLHGGVILKISDSLSGTITVKNNSFVINGAANNLYAIYFGKGDTIVFEFNDCNGLAPAGGTGSGFGVSRCIYAGASPAAVTFEYNYIYNQDAQGIILAGFGPSGLTYISKYNVFGSMGACTTGDVSGGGGCGHGEPEYTFNGNGTGTPSVGQTQEFNLYYQPYYCSSNQTHCPNGVQQNLTALLVQQADDVVINGSTTDHNVALAPGPQGTCNDSNAVSYTSGAVVYPGQQEGGTFENYTISSNYLDNSGAFLAFNGGGGTNITITGNIDAGSGSACNS